MEDRKAHKRKSSQATYEREKRKRDRILIRLDKGQAEVLDAFCGAAGLSRSAFFRRHLDACIAAARATGPQSGDAPGTAILASEFDELFTSLRGE
ncbi:hypothetical protein SNE35_25770 [Paucibacter sp. R3-3]|uniref:Ribbon-helix-helix protein CopG domain-containing protein n=1 Tax=Roseateles agri TaxID=3098619 RepID=A0ABU5DNR3_9BURK|nr:hypothetical protein [Paucibacter sp. R3-3]MDY0747936.1 hypothetical protein [Paucibacter sp. R3-3]